MRSTSCFDSVVKTNWALESISRVTASHKGIVSAVRHLPVPHEAKLSRDGTLTWRWESSVVTREWEKRVVPHRPRKVSSHLWKDFMTLADAEPEKIRAFSERWGPLRWAAIDCQSENVKHWRNFAQLASALIHCSVALGQGKPGTRSHWLVICQWLKIRLDPDLPKPDLAIPAGQKASVALYRRVLLAQALNVLARSQPGKYLDRFRERPTRDCAPGDNPIRHHWITTGLPNYWRQRDDGLSPLYSVLPAGAATDRSKARLLSGLPQESKTTALCNAGLSSSAPALATEVVGNRHREPRVRSPRSTHEMLQDAE